MVKEGDTWSTLSYIPEEVINNMVGTIIIGDKVYSGAGTNLVMGTEKILVSAFGTIHLIV